MTRKNSFQTFESSLGKISEDWKEMAVDLQGVDGSREAHESMAEQALELVVKSDEDLDRFKTGGVEHGMKVISRFLFYVALAAAQQGKQYEELSHIIAHPSAFGQLAMIAERQNKIASRVEMRFGLSRCRYFNDSQAARDYELNGSMLEVKNLRDEINYHSMHVSVQGEHQIDAKCPAHRAEALRPIYLHLADIALVDPRLSQSTMIKALQ